MDKVKQEFKNKGFKDPIVKKTPFGEECLEYWDKEGYKYTLYHKPENNFYYVLITNKGITVDEFITSKNKEIDFIQSSTEG